MRKRHSDKLMIKRVKGFFRSPEAISENIFRSKFALIKLIINKTASQCDVMMLPTNLTLPFSVTRLGDFLKFLATNFLSKVAKTDFWLSGYFEINVQTAVDII